MLTPILPSEEICDGKRPVFATCTILGLYPCCAAWRQNVAKSGGIGNVLKIWQFDDLNLEICEE